MAKIVFSNIIPFKGFAAVNLFGTIFFRKSYESWLQDDAPEWQKKWMRKTINHESIHSEQIKETLYVPFYILYFIFWLVRLLTPPWDTAYKDISFEQEAYDHENDLEYLEHRKPYTWIEYMFISSRKKNG